MNNVDKQFLELLREVYENGDDKGDRTGVGTRSIFTGYMKFKLDEGFPLLTSRFIPLRLIFEETMMFLRGETNTKKLEGKNVNIWKGNTSREFLDDKGLQHLPEGSLGKGYSFQWRNFGGTEEESGVDQIKELLEQLKSNPNSRRHLVSAWNPKQLQETPLPPCHILHQYYVNKGKLSTVFYMRSSDFYHGAPFNIASYALLNAIFAKHLGLEQGELAYMGGDVHIYNSQLEVVAEQLTKEPKALPQLKINKDLNTLDDIMNLQWEDIELIGYEHCGKLKKVDMAV